MLSKWLEKLLGYLAVFFLGKQHERTDNAGKTAQAALDEAQRHADTPATPGDASARLRKRAERKRESANER